MDDEDVGGLLAEQDSYIEDCDDNDGDCTICEHKYVCWASEYRQNPRRRR